MSVIALNNYLFNSEFVLFYLSSALASLPLLWQPLAQPGGGNALPPLAACPAPSLGCPGNTCKALMMLGSFCSLMGLKIATAGGDFSTAAFAGLFQSLACEYLL